MANGVDNSKELNDIKNKITGAEIQKEFMLTMLQSLTYLLKKVVILQKMMQYLTFSIIALAVSFIFLNLLLALKGV